MTDNPFSGERDAALGALLREALEAPDHPAFAARVRSALPAAGAWDLLARWARPGLVAAAVVALAAGLWLSRGTQNSGLSTSDLFASADQSPREVILTLSLEGR
jgi:hypothetical protein